MHKSLKSNRNISWSLFVAKEDVDALNEERGDKQLINLNGKVYAIGGEGRVDASGLVSDEVFFIAAGIEALALLNYLINKSSQL